MSLVSLVVFFQEWNASTSLDAPCDASVAWGCVGQHVAYIIIFIIKMLEDLIDGFELRQFRIVMSKELSAERQGTVWHDGDLGIAVHGPDAVSVCRAKHVMLEDAWGEEAVEENIVTSEAEIDNPLEILMHEWTDVIEMLVAVEADNEK